MDNIHYGDYPVRLSFYILFHSRLEARMQAILRLLLNDETARTLEDSTCFPCHAPRAKSC